MISCQTLRPTDNTLREFSTKANCLHPVAVLSGKSAAQPQFGEKVVRHDSLLLDVNNQLPVRELPFPHNSSILADLGEFKGIRVRMREDSGLFNRNGER